MKNKTVITCAITGGVTSPEQTPYLPITPEQIANSSLEAAEAGAAIVHIHVRNIETGAPSMELELYRDVFNRIKKRNKKLIINLTTGGGSTGPVKAILPDSELPFFLCGAEQRTKHILELKPDICSLDLNTMNRGLEGITINTIKSSRNMINLVKTVGCKPELEIFDSGDYHIARLLIDDGTINDTPLWQFATGVKWGWNSSPETLDYARRLLPPGSVFSAFGIGAMQMPIVAQSWLYGGHVRVGLEDNIYLEKGVLAKSNAELVTKAIRIIKDLGGSIASTEEARKIFNLRPSN
jgi:uncharacterized protein (DUF849 family)